MLHARQGNTKESAAGQGSRMLGCNTPPPPPFPPKCTLQGLERIFINIDPSPLCAAETAAKLKPSLDLLKRHGIGAILDYAAEDDVKTEDGPASRCEPHDSVVARTFDYDNEAKCDQHTSTFLKNIQAASDALGQGFAAIKVNPSSPLPAHQLA